MAERWEPDRSEAIIQALDGILDEGECFLVRCSEGQVVAAAITEDGLTPLRLTHEDLYGCMLSVNEDVTSTTLHTLAISVIVAGILSVAIHLEWLGAVLGPVQTSLQSIWVYITLLFLSFFLGLLIDQLIARKKYDRRRSEIMQALFISGLSRYQLLARLEGDASVAQALSLLKSDSRPGLLGT